MASCPPPQLSNLIPPSPPPIFPVAFLLFYSTFTPLFSHLALIFLSSFPPWALTHLWFHCLHHSSSPYRSILYCFSPSPISTFPLFFLFPCFFFFLLQGTRGSLPVLLPTAHTRTTKRGDRHTSPGCVRFCSALLWYRSAHQGVGVSVRVSSVCPLSWEGELLVKPLQNVLGVAVMVVKLWKS